MSEIKICPPHRYRKINLTKDKSKPPYNVYSCMDCPSFTKPRLVTGKEARCFICREVFIPTSKDVNKMAKLRCKNCIKHKAETLKIKEAMSEVLDNLLDEIL